MLLTRRESESESAKKIPMMAIRRRGITRITRRRRRVRVTRRAVCACVCVCVQVKKLEGELAQAKQHRRTQAERDGWGKEDYTNQVHIKEEKEEAKIKAQVAKDDSDSMHADTVGLDKKHRERLRRMKEQMHDRKTLARLQGNADYQRREKEIDQIMPSDDNCPGANCLRGDSSVQPQHRLFKELHRHPPWHKSYPPEMSNIYSHHRSGKQPWVKVSGGQSDYARHKAEVNHILPYHAKAQGHRR